MKNVIRLISLLLILMLLPVCALGETVVTSFYPIWLLARNLAEGIPGLEVRNLAAPDTGCLHDYQLQSQDMKVLEEADLFLVNGAGMESYLDLVFSAFPDLPVARASDGVPLLYGMDALQIGESEEEEEGEANAHIWLSASNAVLMARNLADAMIRQFPSLEPGIRENLASLTDRLNLLDRLSLLGCLLKSLSASEKLHELIKRRGVDR